jgi:hypothetical protein
MKTKQHHITGKIEIPVQLNTILQLTDCSLQQLLQGFINDLSQEIHGTNGSDERRMAVEYFLRVGYGSHVFEPEHLRDFFSELEEIRRQWPGGSGSEKEKEYFRFRRLFLKTWTENWFKIKNELVADIHKNDDTELPF